MNKRIASFTFLVSLTIIFICAVSAVLYNSYKTAPAIASLESLKKQKNATETAASISTAIAFEQTLAAIPTNTASPTSAPEQIICETTLQENSTIYPSPGQGSSFFSQTLVAGTKIMILGRLADRGWEKIKADDMQGWIRDSVTNNVSDCQPTIYDLHFLQNWLGPKERLILEDTFSFGTPWVDSDGNALFISNAPDGEAYLDVFADELKFFLPKSIQTNDLSAFKIYTSVSLNGVSKNSFIGLRFGENNSHYFQAEIFPSDCRLDVYENDALIYSNNLERKICVDRYYDMSIAISESNRLEIQLNGFDPVSIDLQDTAGNIAKGGYKLVAQNLGLQLHYFIVTATN